MRKAINIDRAELDSLQRRARERALPVATVLRQLIRDAEFLESMDPIPPTSFVGETGEVVSYEEFSTKLLRSVRAIADSGAVNRDSFLASLGSLGELVEEPESVSDQDLDWELLASVMTSLSAVIVLVASISESPLPPEVERGINAFIAIVATSLIAYQKSLPSKRK